MSLILEALRKSEAERRRGTPPQLLDPPLAPSVPLPAPAAPRRLPVAGMVSIAIAAVVLLGMTGYRMFGPPAGSDGASSAPVAAAPAADPPALTARAESMQSASATRVQVQTPPHVAALPPDAMPRSPGALPLAAASAASGTPSPDVAEATGGSLQVQPRIAADRAPGAPLDNASARATAPSAGDPATRAATRLPASTPQPATGASASDAVVSPAARAPVATTPSLAPRARPASGAAPAASLPAAPDRSADLARATPAPASPARAADRSLPTAPALASAAPAPSPRGAAATAPAATPGAGRPVRLADLAPADRRALPALRMSMHLFAAAPAERFVILDGQRLAEGDRVGEAVVEEITADGAVLAWRGQRVWVSVR